MSSFHPFKFYLPFWESVLHATPWCQVVCLFLRLFACLLASLFVFFLSFQPAIEQLPHQRINLVVGFACFCLPHAHAAGSERSFAARTHASIVRRRLLASLSGCLVGAPVQPKVRSTTTPDRTKRVAVLRVMDFFSFSSRPYQYQTSCNSITITHKHHSQSQHHYISIMAKKQTNNLTPWRCV